MFDWVLRHSLLSVIEVTGYPTGELQFRTVDVKWWQHLQVPDGHKPVSYAGFVYEKFPTLQKAIECNILQYQLEHG